VIKVVLVPLMVASVLGAAALFALARPISDLLTGGDEAVSVVRSLAVFLPAAAVLKTLVAASRGFGTMGPTVALDQAGFGLARLLALVIAGALGGHTTAMAICWALPFALLLPFGIRIVLGLSRREAARAPVGPGTQMPKGRLARELWGFSLIRGTAAFLELTVRWIDIPIVAALTSTGLAGIYAAVSKLIMAGTVVPIGIATSIAPHISALVARGRRAGACAVYRTATRWSILATAPFYVALAGYPEVVLKIFGPGFAQGGGALRILALASLINVLTGPIAMVMLMEGRASLNLANSVASVAVNVALNLALIPGLGIRGAAIAWGASMAVANVTPVLQMRGQGYSPGRALLALGWPTACFGIVGIALPAALGLTAWEGLGVVLGVCVPLYIGVLHRTGELETLSPLLFSGATPSVRAG
jgi:O-antigen/teichoic acid export membrane protein